MHTSEMEVSVQYKNQKGIEDVIHLPLNYLRQSGKMLNNGKIFCLDGRANTFGAGNHYFPICLELDAKGQVKKWSRTKNKWWLGDLK